MSARSTDGQFDAMVNQDNPLVNWLLIWEYTLCNLGVQFQNAPGVKSFGHLKIIHLLIAGCLLSKILDAQGIAQHYNAYKDGNEIGRVLATMNTIDGGKQYSVQADVESRMLLKLRVQIFCRNSHGANEVLQTAEYRERATGGFGKVMTTQRQGRGYTVAKNEDLNKRLVGDIVHTSSRLYFEEPIGLRQIFSESNGTMLALESQGNGVYHLHLPDGYVSIYRYKNGVLQSVEAASKFGTVIFKRQQTANYVQY